MFLSCLDWMKKQMFNHTKSVVISLTALADELDIHFRTVQNMENGITSIQTSVHAAQDKLLGGSDISQFVPR